MKEIYNFKVTVDKKDVEVFVKKPSRSEQDDAEFVFSQKFNQLLNAGFLSKSMMNKKFGDIGGLYSQKTVDDLGVAIEKLGECQRVIEFFEGAKDLTDEQKKELKDAKDAYTNIQFNIRNFDRDLDLMYANSADAKAEEHIIKWFVLKTAHYYQVVERNGELKKEGFPLFEGKTFEERLESYATFLDEIDDTDTPEMSFKKKVISASLEKLSRVINIWYNGFGDNQESIEESYKRFFGPKKEEDSEEEKEESKVVAKSSKEKPKKVVKEEDE